MWITSKDKKRGFTLIELLVVIAIIGILATVASVSLIQARRRARDTKRVSDIQQMRNALLLYSNQRATYPQQDEVPPLVLGGPQAGCFDDSNEGFKAAGTCGAGGEIILMQRVPAELTAGYTTYKYWSVGEQDYRITFKLEGEIGDLSEGDCTADVSGITCIPTP